MKYLAIPSPDGLRLEEVNPKLAQSIKAARPVYNYTAGQWEDMQPFIDHFEEGAVVNVTNNLTGKTISFKIETKKAATKITKEWDK